MAKFTVNAGNEYSLRLAKFGANTVEIAKKVVMAGAYPIADEVRKGLIENINDPAYVGKGDGGLFGMKNNESTGDLLESFGIAPPGIDKNGNTNTKIGFDGYDRHGVPNALKARAMESGTSILKKRPFVRPAVSRMKGKAIAEMGKKLDYEIKIYSL